MNLTDIPRKLSTIWASLASATYTHSVPNAGTTSDSGASYQQGFPPKTFQPVGSGGVPVDGRDMNGVLMDLTAWARWSAGGGVTMYDASYSAAVGGYPKDALIASTTTGMFWQSTVDGNTTNPDASGAAGWIPFPSRFVAGDIGYRIASDGFIEQWGATTLPAGGKATVVFPIQFPNYCMNVQATNGTDQGPPSAWPGVGSRTVNSFVLSSAQSASVAPSQAGVAHSWRAIGY